MDDFAVESRYEYDAPRFVDFELLRQGELDDDDVDQWFDTRKGDDESQNMFEDVFSVPSEGEQVREEGDSNCLRPQASAPGEGERERSEREPAGEERVESKVQKQVKMLYTKLHKGAQARKNAGATGKGPLKAIHTQLQKQKRSAALKATASIKTLMNKAKPVKLPSPKPEQKPPELTMPQTPEVLRKHAAKKAHGVSTEELELQEIERLKKEARKQMKMSRRSFQQLAKTSAPVRVKGSKPTTEPVEPQLRAVNRKRRNSASQYESGINPSKFPMTLRSSCKEDNFHPCVPSAKPPTPDGVTKVKPFKFELDSRFPSKDKEEDVVPAAEAVLKFQKTTPERFHSNPNPNPGSRPRRKNSNLTVPKTPKLVAKDRTRPVTVKSQAEREEEEEKEIKSYQFKATRLNPEIFTRGGLFGVPNRRTEASTTVAVSPHLATRERGHRRKEEEEEEEEEGSRQPGFVARPVPKEIFERVMGLPEKRPRPCTCPETPALKKRRIEEPKEEEEVVTHTIKANPMPDFDNVFKPELPHTATEAQPFTFEERYKDKPSRETLVQQILQKEKKAPFKAQVLPHFGTPKLPPKPVQPAVSVQPFNLQTEARGQQYTSKWIEKLAEEAEQAKRMAEFRACEATVLSAEPFVPQKSNKPMTDVSNTVLHTQIRHEQRAKYETAKREKEAAEEVDRQEKAALQEMEEAKRLAKHRRALVHKAQPIPRYAPLHIKPSNKVLTAPKSPVFLTDTRLRGGSQLKTDV